MPVEPAIWAAFLLTAGAVVVTPGPDTMLILRNAMAGGRPVGMATVMGVQLGILIHTALAVLGISVLIATSPILFRAVAVSGALYLGWLGIQSILGRGSLTLGAAAKAPSRKRAFVDAMLCNLLNPKVILLFLALFPQFLSVGEVPIATQLLFLAATLVVINVLWQAPMALIAGRIQGWMTKPGFALATRWVTGVIFIGFAILMLVEHL